MSETPRSINHCDCGADKSHCFDCLFEVSCQLETELAEARAEIERLKMSVEKRRNNMSEYIECPYCGWEQETPDDGYSYDVGIHRKECAGCGRSFAYETTISISYEVFAAPCINGDAEHDWKETKTIPTCFRKLRCSVCGEEKEIEGIEEERKAYLAGMGKQKIA